MERLTARPANPILGKLHIHTETVPVRECSRCHARWPDDWDYCQNCAVWLPGHERKEQFTTVVPSANAADRIPRSNLGATLVAVEVRCGSNFLNRRQLARGRELLKRALTIIGAHGGEAIAIAKRGVAGQWKDLQRGTEQAARALCALTSRTESTGRSEPITPLSAEHLSLGVGVVLIDETPVDQLHRAFRLAALAHPDQLFFSSEAYERVVEQFDFQGLQPIVPKAERLEPVFALVGPKPERSGTHHVGPEKVPMVGRRELLAGLEHCRHQAADGKCVVVHLIAEPGQGKSKLIREWLAECDRLERLDGWTRLSCDGVPYGDYAFRSWRRLVAPLVRARNSSTGAEIASVESIANWLGAAKRPALLVIDDLHWIDTGSRDLIVRLISELRTALVILAYRPSFVPKASLEPPALHRRFQLAPLNRLEMSTLIEMLAEESGAKLSVASKEEIVAKSNGSPLYANEAVAHLIEAGSARARSLPASLIELLILRIQWTAHELLPELERRRRFYQFGGTSKQELLRELERLEERLSTWLDRFDAVEEESAKTVARFVEGLQRVDGELAILSLLLGKQRPHRNRLAQALTRVQKFVDCAGSTIEPKR